MPPKPKAGKAAAPQPVEPPQPPSWTKVHGRLATWDFTMNVVRFEAWDLHGEACRLRDSCSQQAINEGVWDSSPAELPDASAWQTWGVLREFIISRCHTLAVDGCAATDDAFLAELVRLAPAGLAKLVRVRLTVQQGAPARWLD